MSLQQLNSTEIEQVSGGTFLIKAFLINRLFNPQGSGCNTCGPINPAPVQPKPPVIDESPCGSFQPKPPVIDNPCSSGDLGFNKWFKNFKF